MSYLDDYLQVFMIQNMVVDSVSSKKLPNVYKICPEMISLEKLKILTPLQKLWEIWTN